MTLNELKVGEKAILIDIHTNQQLKQRLLDMGFCPNTGIQCVLESPGKDPKAYWVKGTKIAIRSDDAKEMEVKVVKDDKENEDK